MRRRRKRMTIRSSSRRWPTRLALSTPTPPSPSPPPSHPPPLSPCAHSPPSPSSYPPSPSSFPPSFPSPSPSYSHLHSPPCISFSHSTPCPFPSHSASLSRSSGSDMGNIRVNAPGSLLLSPPLPSSPRRLPPLLFLPPPLTFPPPFH